MNSFKQQHMQHLRSRLRIPRYNPFVLRVELCLDKPFWRISHAMSARQHGRLLQSQKLKITLKNTTKKYRHGVFVCSVLRVYALGSRHQALLSSSLVCIPTCMTELAAGSLPQRLSGVLLGVSDAPSNEE